MNRVTAVVFASIAILGVAQVAMSIALMAGTRDDAVEDDKYLKYAEGYAPYTVKITATGSDGKHSFGTATLLADRWAITAAHMVDGAVWAEIEGNKSVRIVKHPQYEEDCMGCYDVALVEFGNSFGRNFYPALSDGEEAVGDLCSVAGYGVSGPMSTGHDTADDRLRAGTCRIDRFDGPRIVCPISRGSSPLPYGISPGDSGGPLFARGKLAGVSLLTMTDKSGPILSRDGEEQAFARVSVIREWIDEVMK